MENVDTSLNQDNNNNSTNNNIKPNKTLAAPDSIKSSIPHQDENLIDTGEVPYCTDYINDR